MRAIASTLLAALLAVSLLGCSSGAVHPPRHPGARHAGVKTLEPLWRRDLYAPANSYHAGITAVAQRYVMGGGSLDNSAGMYNPTPNIALDYGIGDAETGVFTSMPPLPGLPGTLKAIPDRDLFVAVAAGHYEAHYAEFHTFDYHVGVVDPARAAFVWIRRAIGRRVVAMSSTRIWMGRTTPDGWPICLAVADGKVVRHDPECKAAQRTRSRVVEGVSWTSRRRIVDLPGGFEVEVPVTTAQDATTSERLWTYADTPARLEDGGTSYSTSTFLRSALGLIRVDYRHLVERVHVGDPDPPDAVLHLVDPRTGAVIRTIGRVDGGELVGFAGDIAIFQFRDPTGGIQAAGYRLAA